MDGANLDVADYDDIIEAIQSCPGYNFLSVPNALNHDLTTSSPHLDHISQEWRTLTYKHAKSNEAFSQSCMYAPDCLQESIHINQLIPYRRPDQPDHVEARMAKLDLAHSIPSLRLPASPTSAKTADQMSLVEAQRQCLRIATNLLRLPRELRDIIYIQLFNDYPPSFYNMTWPRSELLWPLKCTGPPCNCLHLHPHYIDLNFMGRQVAREVLEVFKPIAAGYHYEMEMQHNEVEDFVTRDVYHVGITREELFRSMDLQIDFRFVLYDKEIDWHVNKDKTDANIASSSRFLMEIPCIEPRSITFVIDCLCLLERPVNLSYVLKATSPAFHGLREKGFSMRLRYKHKELMIDWEFGAAVWDWSTEEWQTNLRDADDADVGFTRVENPSFDTALPPYLVEEQYETEELIWKTIMQDLYCAIPAE